MASDRYRSWGRYPAITQTGLPINWRYQNLPSAYTQQNSFLPYGNGRSYGDVCISSSEQVLDCRGLYRLIAFNNKTGLLRCESGVLFSQIIQTFLPKGWFLPVTPGTQFVTVAGAIANDVHGKNHHRVGTFGCHINKLELLRSDGTRITCSPNENVDWFNATIGGLGLTGVITWAEFYLKRVNSCYLAQQNNTFSSLQEFFTLNAKFDNDYEYTVAWVDCLSKGADLGRGIFMCGNHHNDNHDEPKQKTSRLSFPIDPPFSLVNGISLRLFNSLYFYRQRLSPAQQLVPMQQYFYPLDAVKGWNKLYGRKGFLQYQCVVPMPVAEYAVTEILKRIATAKTGSFLCVLKAFGDIKSPGLLSFPRPGITLALDFPNKGKETLALLGSLDDITRQANGAVYPAKDACMSSISFDCYFPKWRKMKPYLDPAISSVFWRRVTHNSD